MGANFIPPNWDGITLQSLTKNPSGFIRRDAAGNLPTRSVETPHDPEWLDARTAFIERWQAMTARGVAEGWLAQDTCYECAGAIEPTTDTVIRTYEPNPDYIEPVIPDQYRIPRA